MKRVFRLQHTLIQSVEASGECKGLKMKRALPCSKNRNETSKAEASWASGE